MNHLLVGTADKTEQLLAFEEKSFLLIDDGPVADAFLKHYPKAKLFDVTKHSFNPLLKMDHRRARDFAATVYTASPQGQDTLTVRNGRRALARLLPHTERLDKLAAGTDVGEEEAAATIGDILLSPVIRSVLCPPHGTFSFKGQVVAKLDRAALGDFDAFLLGSLLIAQSAGQVILPDFGFYGRDYHASLIRQGRLTAGVNFLRGIKSNELRNACLIVEDKLGHHCLPEDAEILAQFEGLIPGTIEHTTFVQERVA